MSQQKQHNTSSSPNNIVQPEALSLIALEQIKTYLRQNNQEQLTPEELNAVLRLSQHLRLFGLLSAVGYINQKNDQEGKVRERTVPVWQCLLKGLLGLPLDIDKKELMTKVENLAKNEASKYLVMWRQSLVMSNHWNFWARAYAKQE